MEGLSACMIDTRIVFGFQGAGKTSYIRDCVMNDCFYKYGTTLILCFEQGKEKYDICALSEKRAFVAYYDRRMDIEEFCLDPIRKYHPDWIYVEMNTKLPDLRNCFPEVMHVTSAVTWIEWTTIDFFFANFRSAISQMVSQSIQVTFRGCPSKELLAPYGPDFKLMNHRASYLRQDPMGYHEKAFDLFLPYSLDDETITVTANEYLIFWLDAADHPEHYAGKRLCFSDPVELRQTGDGSTWSAGRVVMTCCMADLQFMSMELEDSGEEEIPGGWAVLEAVGRLSRNEYEQKVLKLDSKCLIPAAAPHSNILMPANTGSSGPGQSKSRALFRKISENNQMLSGAQPAARKADT